MPNEGLQTSSREVKQLRGGGGARPVVLSKCAPGHTGARDGRPEVEMSLTQ